MSLGCQWEICVWGLTDVPHSVSIRSWLNLGLYIHSLCSMSNDLVLSLYFVMSMPLSHSIRSESQTLVVCSLNTTTNGLMHGDSVSVCLRGQWMHTTTIRTELHTIQCKTSTFCLNFKDQCNLLIYQQVEQVQNMYFSLVMRLFASAEKQITWSILLLHHQCHIMTTTRP